MRSPLARIKAYWHLECHDQCSFRPGTPNSDRVSGLLAQGRSLRVVVEAAAQQGITTNIATLSRHSKHIIEDFPEEEEVPTGPKASNIEILEAIIAKGFQNRKNWKPTISDTMKAMDMWFRLTQGNPFDELLDTLASAGMGDENPEAVDGASVPVPDVEDEDGGVS